MSKFDPSMGLNREQTIELIVNSEYSIGDQIGILRKKLADPENAEFDTFNEYVNTVKKNVTAEFEALEAEEDG